MKKGIADELARKGSEKHFIGPYPACGITKDFAMREIWS